MTKYCITRIVGNDLPPRHGPNQQLNNLAFILENEQEFEDAFKLWIINRIITPSAQEALIKKLEQYNQSYHVIPFSLDQYDFSWGEQRKITYIIQINAARNFALSKSREIANYCALLDGSIFINQQGWSDLIKKSQTNAAPLYKIYTHRLKQKNEEVFTFKAQLYKREEPMIFVELDQPICFNESQPYGQRDKIELLNRYQEAPYAGYCIRLHDNTRLGFLRWMRERDRNLALQNLIRQVEETISVGKCL